MEYITSIIKSINWVDVLISVLILRCAFTGAKSGLTAELFNFIGVFSGFVLAILWHNFLADFLIINLSFPSWIAQALCFLAIAIAIRFALRFLITIVLKILKLKFTEGLEKIGGILLGLGKGIMVSAIFILALAFVPSQYIAESIYKKSLSGTAVIASAERAYRAVTFFLPEGKTDTSIFSKK